MHRTAPAVPALCNEYHTDYHAISGRTFGGRYERKAHDDMAAQEEKVEQEDREDPLLLELEIDQLSVLPPHHRVNNLSISEGVLQVLMMSAHMELPTI